MKQYNDNIKKKYDRNAALYDFLEYPAEKLLFSKWRKKYFSMPAGNILDVGVGTGKDIDYYSDQAEVIGIDFSERMLKKAIRKLKKSGRKNVTLMKMDVEDLKFEENSFDTIITSVVFCSVPDPVKGLLEIKRVLKPTGRLVMVEHVLSKNKAIAFIENLFNPITRAITGVNINRNTRENIERAGMIVIEEKNLALIDVFRLFVAKK